MKQKTMTMKQRKFFRELVRTFNPTESAMRVYNCNSRAVASVIANQVLKKFNVSMVQLMDYMGMDTQDDLRLLKKLRDKGSEKSKLRALELSLKLKGNLKHTGDINVNTNVHVDNRHFSQIIKFSDVDEDLEDIYDTGNSETASEVHAGKSPKGNRVKTKV